MTEVGDCKPAKTSHGKTDDGLQRRTSQRGLQLVLLANSLRFKSHTLALRSVVGPKGAPR